MRYEQDSAQTPWRWKKERTGDETLIVQTGFCWVIIPGKLCVGWACAGNPKCPPKNPSNPAHGGCLAVCKAFAAYCYGLPYASGLCRQVLKLGCEAICADTCSRDLFGDCYKPCLKLPSNSCGDCCEKVCQDTTGGSSICWKHCNTAPEAEEVMRVVPQGWCAVKY